jgi:hypothetical protein
MSIASKLKDLRNTSADFIYIPFKNAFQPYLLLFLVSFFIYANTFKNEVAYDDEVVLHKNEFVQQGIKGIPGILTHDSYYSYYKQLGMENVLPAGRYRPLALITFAVEQEFIGTIPDGIVKADSWDTNKNRIKDAKEDTNKDGYFTDYDFWSKGAGFRHFVNVLLYAIMVVLIYHILVNYIFSNSKDMIFCSLLLFALHPLHTEVVANIKSRDEILSLIFVFLTLLSSFRYIDSNTRKDFFLIIICMFFALLSKEYALFLFVFIPAVLFVFYKDKLDLKDKNFWILLLLTIISAISFIKFFNAGVLIAIPILFLYVGYYFSKKSSQIATRLIFAMGIALILYLSMRFSATQHKVEIASFQNDIISNPYMFASPEQIWASKIGVWLKYIKLFFIPSPLIVDYSYKTLPYLDFSSIQVWLSGFIYLGLIIAAIVTFFKRSVWSFPLLIILGFFLPVANVFIDIGATMGERLFFHTSLGFSILVMLIVFKLLQKFSGINKSLVTLLLILIFTQNALHAIIVLKRNPVWKNNVTLFTNDVNIAPDNLNLLFGASSAYYQLSFLSKEKNEKSEFLRKSFELANHGISIYPKHDQLYFNKALALLSMGDLDSCIKTTKFLMNLSPEFPSLNGFKVKLSNRLMLSGVDFFQKGDRKKGLDYLVKSVDIDKTNDKAWSNLGKALFELGAKDKALACYQSSLKINPENKIAKEAIVKINEEVIKP